MSEPYIGEIKMFAGNFAPYGFSLCQGQIMPVSQNTALFSILGTAFGGDGRTTYGLPNLGGVAPIGQGQAPGVASFYAWGDGGGAENAHLLSSNMPNHTHPVNGSLSAGVTNIPSATTFLAAAADAAGSPVNIYGSSVDPSTPLNTAMLPQAVGIDGGSQPFSLRNPYLTISFIIALFGEWPAKP